MAPYQRYVLQTERRCFVSPKVFAIYIKPLAQAICQDGELRGVAVRNRDHRISPCTDDMMIYFMYLDASF